MDDVELVDAIYECAILPDLWPGVLDRLAVIGGAVGGILFTASPAGVLNFTSSMILEEAMAKFASSDLLATSQRQMRVLNVRHAGFVTDTDLYEQEEMDEDTLYRDFLYPRGLGWAAGTGVALPTGDSLIVSLERSRAAGPAEPEALARFDILRPHIIRSAFLAARQHLARATGAADALAVIGLPTIVMDRDGRVIVANILVDDLVEHIVWGAGDKFRLKDRGADIILRHAIETIEVTTAAPTRSFIVRDFDMRPALVAHVLPIRGSARDVFARSMTILVLTPVTMGNAPPVELVQSLFDLTPAEARVARGLAAGQNIDEIAVGGRVSKGTVRSQLQSVLAKTGCRRQAEVVGLLGGIAFPKDSSGALR